MINEESMAIFTWSALSGALQVLPLTMKIEINRSGLDCDDKKQSALAKVNAQSLD